MATPAYGSITIQDPNRKTKTVDIYASDVAGENVNFDQGDGATTTSKTSYAVPGNCDVIDVCMASAIVDCAKFQLTIDGQPTGDFFRVDVNHLYSSWRPPMRIPVGRGHEIGFIQRV